MMTEDQAAELLAIASVYDNRKPDRATARGWWLAMKDLDYADCEAAIVAHAQNPNREYLTVSHIIEAVKRMNRQTPEQIAADVRSARARGLVPRDWPERDELTPEVRRKLDAIREGETVRALAEIERAESGPQVALDTGVTLRRV